MKWIQLLTVFIVKLKLTIPQTQQQLPLLVFSLKGLNIEQLLSIVETVLTNLCTILIWQVIRQSSTVTTVHVFIIHKA